jgi:hypothetical protein
MKADKRIPELLEKLEWLYEKYSHELRAGTQPYHLQKILAGNKAYEYHPDDPIIRESLLEHIGVTPMVATTIYPYVKDKKVDLGNALTMLAIHDIGELITGDENTFIKKSENKMDEQKAALRLLDISYHELYKDSESQTSQSAKFAKAVDKIVPDILDYLTPADITIARFKHFVGIEPEKIPSLYLKYKRPYMLWNPFMTEFHIFLVEKIAEKLK